MSNNQNGNSPAVTVASAAERATLARTSYDERARSDHWKPLPGISPIDFMALRLGVCRWPINAAPGGETLRYCGCPCEAALSYCQTHGRIAFIPARPRIARARDGSTSPTRRAA